jgi:thymidylate synthase (FAD)
MIQVTYKGHMGNDLTVVNAARVSFGKESEWDYEESDAYSFKQHMKLKDKKLIKYLAKHKHISPFGHCFASFILRRCPVFVERQLVKHKFYA